MLIELCALVFVTFTVLPTHADEHPVEMPLDWCSADHTCLEMGGTRRAASPSKIEGPGYKILARLVGDARPTVIVEALVAGRTHLLVMEPIFGLAELRAVGYNPNPVDPELTTAERRVTADLVTNQVLRAYLTSTNEDEVRALANELIRRLAEATDAAPGTPASASALATELKSNLRAVKGAGVLKSSSQRRIETLAYKANECLGTDRSTFRLPATIIEALTFGTLKTYRFSRCVPADSQFLSRAVERAAAELTADLRLRKS